MNTKKRARASNTAACRRWRQRNRAAAARIAKAYRARRKAKLAA